MNKLIKGEKGQVMILALILLAVGGLIIAPLLSYMSTGLIVGQVHEERMDELYAADAGIELALWHLIFRGLQVPEDGQPHSLPSTPFTMNYKDVYVTVENMGEQVYKIISTAGSTIIAYVTVIAGGEFTTIEGGLTVLDYEEYTGNVIVDGNIHIGDGGTLNGSVIASGSVTILDGGVINGHVCAGGDVYLADWTTINGNVYAAGDVELGDWATIDGDVYLGGTLTQRDTSTITGDYPLPYSGCGLPASGSEINIWEIS